MDALFEELFTDRLSDRDERTVADLTNVLLVKEAFTPVHALYGGLAGAYNAPQGYRLEGAKAGATGATLGGAKGLAINGVTGAATGAALGLLPAVVTGGASIPVATATGGAISGALGSIEGGIKGYKRSMEDLRQKAALERGSTPAEQPTTHGAGI